MFSIKHNIPATKKKIVQLVHMLEGEQSYQKAIIKQFKKATRQLKRSTPRSKGGGSQKGGEHLADGWTLHTIGGQAKDRKGMLLTIYNRYTHSRAGRPKASAKLIDGKTGMLVPAKEPQPLAEAMSKLLNDKGLARTMGEAGYLHLQQNFSVQKMVMATEELYKQIVS